MGSEMCIRDSVALVGSLTLLETVMAFFNYHINGIDDVFTGICTLRGICQTSTHATSIVRWSRHTDELVQTIAHEIGHAIGMWHDFESYKDDWRLERRGTCGPPKHESGEGNYIMNYGHPKETAWSVCSNIDFANFYNTHLVEEGSFCLAYEGKSFSGTYLQGRDLA